MLIDVSFVMISTMLESSVAYYNQWFSNGEDFAPQGHLVISGDIFGFHNWELVVLASSKPGMLLNIL